MEDRKKDSSVIHIKIEDGSGPKPAQEKEWKAASETEDQADPVNERESGCEKDSVDQTHCKGQAGRDVQAEYKVDAEPKMDKESNLDTESELDADSKVDTESELDAESEVDVGSVEDDEDFDEETETGDASEGCPDEDGQADDGSDPDDDKEKGALFGKGKKKKKKTKILEMELEKAQTRTAELKDSYQRLMAEFDNARKRMDKEKSQMYDIGAKAVLEKLLPVVDNFERGLDALSEEEKQEPFAQGIEKIYQQLMAVFSDLGVSPMDAAGKEFNPDFHNAVMHVEDEELPENVVAEEFQKGYMYKDSVLRHSMVKVAN